MNNFIDVPVIEGFLRNGELLYKMAKLPASVKGGSIDKVDS